MKTKIFTFILFFVVNVNLFGQVLLTSEEITGQNYKLKFTNEIPYNLYDDENIKRISFNGFMDESKTGEFILPIKDIFINIPAGSKPTVNFSAIRVKSIAAIPENNPMVIRLNDSTNIYREAESTFPLSKISDMEVKGYLTIGKDYCIHIKVHPYYFDYEKRSTIKIEEFEIELNFQNALNAISKNEVKKNILTANKKYHFATAAGIISTKPSVNDSWIDFSKSYAKISADHDGIYRLGFNDLAAANVPVNSINPKSLKMYYKGNEIPIYVEGESDNQFNSNDYIEFIGRRNPGDIDYREVAEFNTPYKEYFNRYSNSSVYWLTWDGADGIRVQNNLNVSGSASQILDYYDELLHVEKNYWYDYAINGDSRRQMTEILESETWNWWGQDVGTRNFSFSTSDLYPDKPANAYVKLQSWSNNISNDAHLLHLKINNETTAYDSGYIDRYEIKTLHASFNSNSLIDGSNKLKIISEPTASNPNRCFGDWWEIEYPRYSKAIDDSLLLVYRSLSNSVFRNMQISNVQTADVVLYKFYDDYNNVRITNFNRTGDEVTFSDTVKPGDKYLISSIGKINKPQIEAAKQFVNLSASSNQADYILITHPIFLSQAQSYLTFIEDNYSVSTKLINVFDIYDEFNFGFLAPEPIKDFLQMTHNTWQAPAPKNIFIVGRANYDFHGYKTTYLNTPEEPVLVPSYGEPVSDNWFVIWDNTGAAIPQINIGRLPARTVEEFAHYLAKHQNYINAEYSEWNKSYIMFSGGSTKSPSEISQLKGANEYVKQNLIDPAPVGGMAKHFYKTINPLTNYGPYPPEEVEETINNGSVIISYLGHSGTQTWDNGITDPTQLNNNVNRSPMISDFGCSTAKFAEPDITSFSELFVNGLSGQAIMYVGNSSLGYLSTALAFPKIFFGKILRDSVYNIGDAHRLAKMELLDQFGTSSTYTIFSYTNTLVGDPIINLAVPQKPDFTISAENILFNPQIPLDNIDSLEIDINYFNRGSVSADSIIVKIEDSYLNNINYSKTVKIPVPLNYDDIKIKIPIKDLPGIHTLKVTLDESNIVDELNEDNNLLEIDYSVLTASIRTTNIYSSGNRTGEKIVFVNPSADPLTNSFDVEIGTDNKFNNSVSETVALDSFFTVYNLGSDYINKRFYLRSKLSGTNKIGVTQSYLYDGGSGFYADDSVTFAPFEKTNNSYKNDGVSIDTSKINYEIISAGFNDGKTAVVAQNGQNLIPENTLRGHHVCIFADSTHEFIQYKRFDVFSGTSEINRYITFLDTLNENYLFLVAVADEGRVTNSDLKDKIKEYGSVLIDSLSFRGSWAFMGKKNADPGSMPEAFSHPFNGRVSIDSLILRPETYGKLVSTTIGPVVSWESVRVEYELIDDSKVSVKPIRINKDEIADTLDYLNFENNIADLSFIDAAKYPKLKFIIELNASSEGISPKFNALYVTHSSLPEIGTNYQVVSISKDTVDQGEDVEVSFMVYNVGGVSADSIKVIAEVVNEDLSKEVIYNNLILTLDTFENKKLNFTYNTLSSNGPKQFLITIDPENKIDEIFEDNNFYTIPFNVRGDTTRPDMLISFDGKEIIDGDMVSSTPLIKIELNDPSLIPITDTSAVLIQLNNQPVYYSKPDNNITYTYSSTNPKMIVEYKPELESGEYFLNVFAKDASGNLVNPAGETKSFQVETETNIMDIFNYPNPFANETYFTFKLTQIPDELDISVYTVAGRLIKQISVPANLLTVDFNKIYWDGLDEEGERLANGVYFYKVIMKSGTETHESIHKMAVLR